MYCGVRADGTRVNFARECEACKQTDIVYYFDTPCNQVPFVCDKDEKCNGYYCISSGCRTDEQCPYSWQTCINGNCVDKCTNWKCANCKYGQCGYVPPYGQCRGDNDCQNSNWSCDAWKCKDACWNVKCPSHYRCSSGKCIK